MPAHQGPKGHFGSSIFWLITCYICLLYYALVHIIPCNANLPRVTLQFGLWPQRLTHGTRYKQTWPLCQNHVTRLLNYPASLCILYDFCCNTRRCNFNRWSPRGETAHNKATQNPNALGVRPSSYPKTTHRSTRSWDTTRRTRNKMWFNIKILISVWLIN